MITARLAFFATILAAAAAASCGGGPAQTPGATSSPSAGKSTLPTCRWAPVKPDTEERCTLTNKGAQMNMTQRDSMRAQDQRTITVTCVCE
jgi:hypothetical protein